MNVAATAGILIGGLGLLLIGMSMMTDGLKLAAGGALRDILAIWTNSRSRGLTAGILITALVQSSSAVTVATIGFANAGLLTLEQSVWVIFGSNVGTTMTGWIVALIGFQLDIEAFALPMIGIGMILRLTGRDSRRAYFGQALIGFGLLFVGIGVLKEVFEGIGTDITVPQIAGPWLWSIAIYVVVGMFLTTLMQSSSAALVIALSAAEGELIPLEAAAALAIGANLGTTTTAVMAVWDATSTAKRVALSHVIFNVVAASVAMLLLTPMLFVVEAIRTLFNFAAAPAITLALFHTSFNLLGVALVWPLSERLTAFLSGRFRTQEEIESRPRFLDRTVIGLPQIAITALTNEVGRINALTVSAVSSVLHEADATDLAEGEDVARSLANAVGAYSAELSRTQLPPSISELLPDLLRSAQQYTTVIETAKPIETLQEETDRIDDPKIRDVIAPFRQAAIDVLEKSDTTKGSVDLTALSDKPQTLEESYDRLKDVALRQGANGSISVVRMDAVLRYAAMTRRAVSQTVKATRRLVRVQQALRLGEVGEPIETDTPIAHNGDDLEGDDGK